MKEDSNEMNQHPPAPTSTNTTNGLEKDKIPNTRLNYGWKNKPKSISALNSGWIIKKTTLHNKELAHPWTPILIKHSIVDNKIRTTPTNKITQQRMNKQPQTNKAINNGWTNSPNQESTQLWMKKKQPQPLMYSSMDKESIISTYKEVNYGWTNNQAQLMKGSMVDEYEQAQLSKDSIVDGKNKPN